MDMDMNMMEPLGILIMVMVLAVGVTAGILIGVRIVAAREDRQVDPEPHGHRPVLGQARGQNPWTAQRLTRGSKDVPTETPDRKG
jgi:hypothetical protein